MSVGALAMINPVGFPCSLIALSPVSKFQQKQTNHVSGPWVPDRQVKHEGVHEVLTINQLTYLSVSSLRPRLVEPSLGQTNHISLKYASQLRESNSHESFVPGYTPLVPG